MAVFAVGAVGLAGALTAAALAAPERSGDATTAIRPNNLDQLVARVPARDPSEVAARRALASDPSRVEAAVQIARAEIQRSRETSDPRYLGRAQATLAPWWAMPQPPTAVLLLRATIEQALHDFSAARRDLDLLVTIAPEDPQGHLTRAVVATVTADYAAARASCAQVARLAPGVIAATCLAPIDAITGDANGAYARLGAAIDAAPRAAKPLLAWSITAHAEIAIQRGDLAAAERELLDVLAIDPEDAYARATLADVLLATHRPAEASALLEGREQIDSALVRRAIAEHLAHGKDEARIVQLMRDRIALAAQREDRVHLREEARFMLAVENDPGRALQLARDNWVVQKELADARLLAEAASAAHDPAAAEPVRAWARNNQVHDAALDEALR